MNCLSLFAGPQRNSARETKCCRSSSASFPFAIPFFLSLDENAIFAKKPNDPSTYATFVLEKSERRRRPDIGVAATLGALSNKNKIRQLRTLLEFVYYINRTYNFLVYISLIAIAVIPVFI